ncbi:MAG: division/cell wall cluster transcriptional repressor MraZ [Bacilli bacterium]|nr:division/cell wall cluster transcriptional repressor MraZ [Bacilli bacterium]
MLMGEYHHNIDEKGRLTIPSKFREDLKDKFVITRGLENCLFAYSVDDFQKIVSELQKIPFTKKDARGFMRFFLSGATEVEFDKQGRINISSPLISFAGLKKECVIIGTGDRLEIWSKEGWDEFFNSTKDNMSDIAEGLFDTNINI